MGSHRLLNIGDDHLDMKNFVEGDIGLNHKNSEQITSRKYKLDLGSKPLV